MEDLTIPLQFASLHDGQGIFVVWTCLPFVQSGQNHLARYSERGKKTGQIKEVGRQDQGMDRPGVRQVQEGSGE